jgi:hypothetical protein
VARPRVQGHRHWRPGFDAGTYTPLVRAQVEYALPKPISSSSSSIPSPHHSRRPEVADLLRRSNKPVLLIANKADSHARRGRHHLLRAGIGEPIAISAHHGHGVADAD